MRTGPSNQPGHPQTYREFCEETSRSLAAYYRSREDSDAVDATHAPPTPLAKTLPEPPSTHFSAEVSNFPHFSAEASNTPHFSDEASRMPAGRPEASRISRSRSKTPPGGLSGLLFTDAVHRMLKWLAHTQLHVGIEWLTLLQIFTENGGNGASRFHNVYNITIIPDYAIVSPDRQPDIWFSLRDNRSLRALTYFVRLSTRYAWWTCRFVDVLQAPTTNAALAIGRILRRLSPTLHGITFPQSPDFWFGGRRTIDIRRSITWLPIDQTARQYVRGVDGYANHLIEPEYWTQSRLIRMHTEGCSWCSYTHPDTNQYMTVFSFYRDLPPRRNATEHTEETEVSQRARFYTNLPETTDNDYALQATLRWPSNFFFFWENFGTHYTVVHIRLIDRCHFVSPREFTLQLMLRIRDWPHLRHVQIELIHPGETQPGDSVSVPNQATEFAVETYVRCQAIRSALQDQQPPLPSEVSVTAELDCWHASADEVQQIVARIRRILEGPQQQVTIEQSNSAATHHTSSLLNGPGITIS
ncbi:hypothetical protein AAVH_08720 [Aphelenchoides avenae]|nr:hypothetical protein AAVH_08720 [Aphelenchus avenae]